MKQCFQCGEELETLDPCIELPQFGHSRYIYLCELCAEDVEHFIHTELESIKKHRKLQWIGGYGE